MGEYLPGIFIAWIEYDPSLGTKIRLMKFIVNSSMELIEKENVNWDSDHDYEILNLAISRHDHGGVRVVWEEDKGNNINRLCYRDLIENQEEDSQGNFTYTYSMEAAQVIQDDIPTSCELRPDVLSFKISKQLYWTIVVWQRGYGAPPEDNVIRTYARGFQTDLDADWGKHVYKGKHKNGSLWKKVKSWFGYSLHLLVDAT